MYSNTLNYWPQDATRINLKNEAELKYWEERFNASVDDIREAIYEVGPITIAVDRYLEEHKHRNIAA